MPPGVLFQGVAGIGLEKDLIQRMPVGSGTRGAGPREAGPSRREVWPGEMWFNGFLTAVTVNLMNTGAYYISL